MQRLDADNLPEFDRSILRHFDVHVFLLRFTLFKIGKLHVRLHKIVDKDQTTLFHNHPFRYISVILKGGYTEHVLNSGFQTHGVGSIIFRSNETYHRIESIQGETVTLFIAWGEYGWSALNPQPTTVGDGLLYRKIQDEWKWAKRENGIWFIGNRDKELARNEIRHSIHQFTT